MRLELKKGSTGALAGMMRELEALRDFFASATLTAVVDVPFIILTLLIVGIIGGPVVLVPGADGAARDPDRLADPSGARAAVGACAWARDC